MSYPGYPPNNQGYPRQPGIQQPGSLPHPQYPGGNIGQQGYPMPTPMPSVYPPGQSSYPQQSPYPPGQSSYPQQSPYPPGQSSYPQQSPYPPGGHYPPQQQPGQFLPQPGQYASNAPSVYPPLSTVGQYLPQAPLYQNEQTTTNYPQQASYPPTQQAHSIYPNTKIDGYSTPAHHLPTGNSSARKQSNPTLRPANPFDAQNDAQILRKAMKGFGTDEKAIIQVLAHRVNSQRLEISRQFKTMYGKDLISDLKSELSGKFEDLIVALMTPTTDFLAKELHYAVDGIGTDEEIIIEIMCTSSNAEIRDIKMAYKKLFGKNLENDLKGDTSGYFRRLLVSLCQGNRSESTVVDIASARADAQSLFEAGENRLGTDEATFNMILCSRSFIHLKQMFEEYHRLTGREFDSVIKSEFSGDIKNGHLAIVRCATEKSGYFAKRLRESIAGLGTDDRTLIRIVATRCEIDMVDIKNYYMSMYGKTLEADIAGDTSGDYKKCLTALVVG